MSEPLLKLEGLEVVYHRVITAIQGISLEVPRGGIVALLGTNGAGKTTTLRAISGFIGLDDARVTEGAIVYGGTRIENFAPHRVTALGIALVPERSKVFENLTVGENLEAVVARRGADRKQLADSVYALFPALACAPDLLLVDELSQGLAPVIVEELAGRLQKVRAELGTTVLLVEQNAHVALDIADYAYVMESGRIVLDGTPERLRAHADIQEFYLGAGAGSRRRSYRDVKQYRRSRRWYG